MSDLISRSELLKRLEEWNTSDKTDKALYNFALNRIIEQPTAYSVDKVVEELESELKKGNIAIDFGEFRLFEIVKQCVVSDDVCEWKQTSTAKYKTSCGYKLEEYFDTNACYCKQCGRKIRIVGD